MIRFSRIIRSTGFVRFSTAAGTIPPMIGEQLRKILLICRRDRSCDRGDNEGQVWKKLLWRKPVSYEIIAPLQPALPPMGAGAHVMPDSTCTNTICFFFKTGTTAPSLPGRPSGGAKPLECHGTPHDFSGAEKIESRGMRKGTRESPGPKSGEVRPGIYLLLSSSARTACSRSVALCCRAGVFPSNTGADFW
jgi:hypothetical protein